MTSHNQPARRAEAADQSSVVQILVSAFHTDPTWAWAFPDPQARAAQHARLWTLFVQGAQRYPWVWLAAGNTATSVWIPPSGTELSEKQEAELEALLVELLGADASRVLHLVELFEQVHPRDEPHFYLTLLGTHADHRGHGYGLGLLGENLRRIDDLGLPAYLEASNPGNVALYERYGFRVLTRFSPPPDGPVVTTMWRPPVSARRRD